MLRYGQGAEAGADAGPLLQVQAGSLEQLRRFAEAGYLFALLDSADRPKVPEKARELGDRAVSLIHGAAQEDYSAVAPYLLNVDRAVLDWIVANLWSEPWGVFALAKADLESLRTHFRRFLIVQLPDGEKWFFRFYDPRILSPYLGACKKWEVEKFFGPVRAYAIANSQGISLVQSALQPAPTPSERITDPNASILWQIRQEQVAALGKSSLDDFIERMVVHLNKFFPEQCQALGQEKTQEAVRYGIQRAASYEITAEPDVCKYVDLMFGFGRDFDTDPRYPWAIAALKDPGTPDPTARINRLCDLAVEKAKRAEPDASEVP